MARRDTDVAAIDAARGRISTVAAEIYEEFFLPALFAQWVDPVLDRAGVSEGDTVVDVGCGTGVLARAAALRVAEPGHIIGVDPNEGMLAVASRYPGVDWRVGVAESLPVEDDSIDATVSQFAMMFFEDKEQAVTEFKRILRPGGRVAVATWSSLEETPGYAAVVDLLDRLFGPTAGDAMRVPFSMGDQNELHELLRSEFTDVTVSMVEGTARFPSIDEWVHTDVRGWTLSDMSDADFDRLLDAARNELSVFTRDDGSVEFAAPALIATGRVTG